MIKALHDKVERSCVLFVRPKSSCAPQLHLLEEWALSHPKKFCCKLCVDLPVFEHLVNMILAHPVFYNNSNNPQLPVPMQLTIFLNSTGHYGNAVTTEDIAEWAGVSTGTHHNAVIHFNLLYKDDQIERERAKTWVEEQTCPEWRGGFLCVDSTQFNMFQKPGWHGEGFHNRKSNYSLSAQVMIMPHNLRIVNYVISIPGSTFLDGNEWIWADSAYGSRPWCVVPFKRPSAGPLKVNQLNPRSS
ncbi:hypothetical protein BDR05DRAFT_974965 [Suillus weaverae]|nr:hypothetical protein BDR05DRAFT_974965 [Suillus weaverae]